MAISKGQTVAMKYALKVEGDVVDTNIGGEPLEFVFGSGQILRALESRLTELNEGEEISVVIPPEEAYGETKEEAFVKMPKSHFEEIDLSVGLELQGTNPEGEPVSALVKEIYDDEVLIDFNHPLAGKDLHFKIIIVSIK